MLQRPFRIARRLVSFLCYSVGCVQDFRRTVLPFEATGKDYRRRSEWIHRNAKRLCRLMNWEVTTVGAPPEAAIYCANHLGYLDIVMLGAATPVVFVSKAEVQKWPIMGTLAECGGTLFLRREKKGDLLEVSQQFEGVISQGVPIVIFLEGTSSNGEQVLPFRSSLLAPAVAADWSVAPVALDYSVSDGTVAQDVAYWGEMNFGSHFVNLLSKRHVAARIAFGATQEITKDRKVLARRLQERVLQLRKK